MICWLFIENTGRGCRAHPRVSVILLPTEVLCLLRPTRRLDFCDAKASGLKRDSVFSISELGQGVSVGRSKGGPSQITPHKGPLTYIKQVGTPGASRSERLDHVAELGMVYGAFQGAWFSKTGVNVHFVKIYSKSSEQLLLPQLSQSARGSF